MAKFRTLLRINRINHEWANVIIAAIEPQNYFIIHKSVFPFPITEGMRLHAKANLHAETTEELQLSDFESQ